MLAEEIKSFVGSNVSIYAGESCFRGDLIKAEDNLVIIKDSKVGEIYINPDHISAWHRNQSAHKSAGFIT